MPRKSPDVQIISLRHSGTRWLMRTLESWGLSQQVQHVLPNTPMAQMRGAFFGTPLVMPVRDPCMVAASQLNRWVPDETEGYAVLDQLATLPHAHLVYVDCPESERDAQYQALAAFLGIADPPPADWTHPGAFVDRLGLQARYRAGEIPPELALAHGRKWQFPILARYR